jgi:hypothetical protein
MTPPGLRFSVWYKPGGQPRQGLMITAIIRRRTLGKEKGGDENDCKI